MEENKMQTLQLSPHPDSHHPHRVLLYAVGALLIIIISLSAGYLLSMSSTPQSVQQVTSTPIISKSILTPSSQDISSWKVYINSNFKYAIKYPSDWTVSQDASGNAILLPPGADLFASTPQNTPGSGLEPNIAITLLNKPVSQPNGNDPGTTNTSQFTTLAGIKGYYYTVSGAPISQTFADASYASGTKILEFKLLSIVQENIDQFNLQHHTQVKDADIQTFQSIVQTLKYL